MTLYKINFEQFLIKFNVTLQQLPYMSAHEQLPFCSVGEMVSTVSFELHRVSEVISELGRDGGVQLKSQVVSLVAAKYTRPKSTTNRAFVSPKTG